MIRTGPLPDPQTLQLCTKCSAGYAKGGSDRCYRCSFAESVITSGTVCQICGNGAVVTLSGICAACYKPAPTPPVERKRPDWDAYFFDMARLVAKRATCPRASIGVVIVDDKHRVVATGYNGAPAGEPHCTAVGCTIFADHCVRARHAEVAALAAAWEIISTAAAWDIPASERGNFLVTTKGAAYVIGPRPICSHCARELHAAGIVSVKWKES